PPTRAGDFMHGYIIAVRDELQAQLEDARAKPPPPESESKPTVGELLARPCWSCGVHSREWFEVQRVRRVIDEAAREIVSSPHICVVCGKHSGVHPTLCFDHDPEFGARAEQAPQAEATPPDECVHGVHLSEDCPACANRDTDIIRAAEGVTLEPGE